MINLWEETIEVLENHNKTWKDVQTIYGEEPDVELFSGIYYCPNCKETSAYDVEDIAEWEED